MFHKTRSLLLVGVLAAAIVLSIPGCASPQQEGASPAQPEIVKEQPQTVHEKSGSLPQLKNPPSEPVAPITVELSFPDGAPPLNQTAELRCTVKTRRPANDISVQINLPDAFELVSGNLSWLGSIPADDESEVIRAVVKSVKVGNWTIEGSSYIDPKKHGEFGGNGRLYIYVSVSEDSAAWGIAPPWYKRGSFPVPVERLDEPSTPIKVRLSLSDIPELNTPVKLICTVSSRIDISNTTAQIVLPNGATSVGGNLTWQGNLKAHKPVTFSAEIVLNKVGNTAIEGTARHVIDEKNSWGDVDIVYLNVGADRSTFGWPRTGPAKIEQIEKGDVEPVKSSFTEEPGIEDRPDPPAISVDGILEKTEEHHSITVTGTYKYWTKLGDYRDIPDTLVPAKHFLVELCSDSGSTKAYGYTDSQGHFEIEGVDPSGDIKARLWCYIIYSPNNYELRVVDQGNSLTGLTDVWHTGFTDTYEFPDDGGTYSIGTYSLPQGVEGDGAFWIKDDLDRAFRYPPTQPGSCTVKWTESSTDGAFYDTGGQIHLKAENERRPDCVVHEYGHNVMYNLYGFVPPVNYGPDGEHTLEGAEEPGCGWVEGWANFFALVVNDNPSYTFPNNQSTNLETPTWGTPGWDDGDTVEGRVAGALWDLFDDVDDDYTPHQYDEFDGGFDDIWETFSTQTDNTFAEFWGGWCALGYNMVDTIRSLYQNTIDYPFYVDAAATGANNGRGRGRLG